MAQVAVVTDSTSYLPPGWARRASIEVVPVQVIVSGHAYDETDDDQASAVVEALSSWQPVTTSRPSPVRFVDAFTAAVARGAESIAVVTLSSSMSATHESAVLAARECAVPVEVVDSRSIAMALGFAALEGSARARLGEDLSAVASGMKEISRNSQTFFYVDTLEYLRRGGRIGSTKAAVAQALQVKPILQVVDGQVVQLDQVRTAARALARLEALAVDAVTKASDQFPAVDIAVQHLAAPERAVTLAAQLRERFPSASVVECPVGGVVGAHVGPGMVAVVVSPRSIASLALGELG